MTVIQYCREKTNVRELVIIREGGWVMCVAFIDHEDLFRLPPSIARAEVVGEECGRIRHRTGRAAHATRSVHLSRYLVEGSDW